MALSGTISKTISGTLKYVIEWSATQSVANNTSTITCKHYLKGSSYSLNISTRNVTCTVDGTSKSFTSSAVSGKVTSVLLGTTTHTVNHLSDGSKSCTIKGTFPIAATLSGSYISSVTASSTVTLNTIARAATITSASNFNDTNYSPTIYYTNSAGNSVTSLQACISLTGSNDDIAYRDVPKTGTSYTFSLTSAEMAVLVNATTSNSRTVYFYLKTVLGGTTYSSKIAKTFSLTSSSTEITMNPEVYDTNSATLALTGDSSIMVYGKSTAAYEFNASVSTGSIKSYRCTNGSISGISTGTGTGVFYNVYWPDFVFTVTDSRGNTASKTVTCTIVPYVNLTCNLDAPNPSTSGSTTVTVSGNVFNGSFGATTNTLKVYYRYKVNGGSYSAWTSMSATKSGNTYEATTTITGLDYKSTYVFQAYSSDSLMTVYSNDQQAKGTPVFHWDADDFAFEVPVNINGNLTVNGSIEVAEGFEMDVDWNNIEPSSGVSTVAGSMWVEGSIDTTGDVRLKGTSGDMGVEGVSLWGVYKALTTSYKLTTTVTPASGWTVSDTTGCRLFGNNLFFHMNMSSSTSYSGNVENVKVMSVSIDSGYKVSEIPSQFGFCTSTTGPVSTFYVINTAVSLGEITFDVYLSATGTSGSSFVCNWSMPCRINTDWFA